MDTVVEYRLYGERGQEAVQAIDTALRDIENRMSLYQSDSEIEALNGAAGRGWVPVSADTLRLLALCREYGEESGGVFDVTVAPLTQLWGVTSGNPRVPSQEEIDALLGLVDYRDLLLDEPGGRAMLAREGQAVDLGGIAKGFACDVARGVAEEYGITSGWISIGGNLMSIGEKPGDRPFTFGVRDPRGGDNDFLGKFTMQDSTAATSGDYERYFERDGVRYHHILDPATGRPAETDLWSVTVVTPDGARADYLSTYLFLRGRDFTLARLDSLGCGLVVVDEDRNVYVSKDLADDFTPTDQTGTYRFEVNR